ncbi:MAG: glycosyltransferase [Spirochaetota bacterium]|nr:MAG: glycosyltransferase [Spirochaetota bacterium]
MHKRFQQCHEIKQCGFRAFIGSFKTPTSSSLMDELEQCESIFEAYSFVSKRIPDWIPCITDEYSSLRYATFILEQSGIAYEELSYFSHSNKIFEASIQEARYTLLLKKYGSADPLFRWVHNTRELASLLKSIVKTKTWVSPGSVLDQLGQSPYIDSIVRDIVRSHIRNWDRENFCKLVLQKIENGTEELCILLDILAEHRLNLLQEDYLYELLNKWELNQGVYNALLRYIGECNVKAFIPFFDKKLQSLNHLSISKAYSVLDVLTQIGDKQCLPILERFRANIPKSYEYQAALFLSDYAELASREISIRETTQKKTHKKGTALVQCAFYGDIVRPRQSEGGGLATLLVTLGDKIARAAEWDHIYTLFLFPMETDNFKYRLIEQSGNEKHHIVRVPVSFSTRDRSNQFMIHEYEIMRTVKRTLKLHCIDPDIIHIRYSDNASKAVAILSEKLKKRLVFTLTPDPHRSLSGNNGRLLNITKEEALFNLNKVYIADRLVEISNGVILIGHDRKNDQIIPYFPELCLKYETQKKPINIVPEGINMHVSLDKDETYDKFLEFLTDHNGCYTLESGYMERPIILNVGRLNIIKGQHLLFDAWAQSKLSEIYNLVLVGGNLDRPKKSEKMVLEHIEKSMEVHPELNGLFCLLHALPNRDVRILEKVIMETINAKMPNVYACSSIKEEFGISILEAMSVGFLVIAPLNGGVSSYIKNRDNGYLIETHSAEAIKLGMESVLLSENISPEHLKVIAGKGKTLVKEVFDIEEVAKIFSKFYHNLIETKE